MPRLFPLALAFALALPMPALASSGDDWEAFRKQVEQTCLGLLEEPGKITIEVDPFGSQTWGVALISVVNDAWSARYICVMDKATGAAEISSGLPDQ